MSMASPEGTADEPAPAIIRRIDAHQHFWQLGSGLHPWPTSDMPELYRDFGPADLAPLLGRHKVIGTVLVQAAPSVAETHAQLALAARHDFVLGVVGWVDLGRREACASIRELAAHPKLKGLRPMLQQLPDDDWVATRVSDDVAACMIDLGLAMDALVLPRHLPHVLTLAQRHPQLRIVIDHAAKPDLEHGSFEAWRKDMAALAVLPQLACKLSGLLGLQGADGSIEQLQPYVDALLGLFGPSRLMWGSDWPVLNRVAHYARWVDVCERLTTELGPEERLAFWAGTALRFYRLYGKH